MFLFTVVNIITLYVIDEGTFIRPEEIKETDLLYNLQFIAGNLTVF